MQSAPATSQGTLAPVNGDNVLAGPASAGGGGFGGGGSLSTQAIAYLEANQGSAKYLLAASGSQVTAPIIISTGKAVVTIGGFGAGDPAPTVTQLAQLVSSGQLKYVLLGSGGGHGRGGAHSAALDRWVQAHGTKVTAVTVSSGTLYK